MRNRDCLPFKSCLGLLEYPRLECFFLSFLEGRDTVGVNFEGSRPAELPPRAGRA
jgi:hypothetical protein